MQDYSSRKTANNSSRPSSFIDLHTSAKQEGKAIKDGVLIEEEAVESEYHALFLTKT